MKNPESDPGGHRSDNEEIVIYSSGEMQTVTDVFVRDQGSGKLLPTLLTGDARKDVSAPEPTDN